MSYPTVDRGTALRIQATVKDFSGVLTSPSEVKCEIIAPTGGVYLTSTTMTTSSTGIYLIDKQTAESDTPGLYEVVVRATNASFTSLNRDYGFQLE